MSNIIQVPEKYIYSKRLDEFFASSSLYCSWDEDIETQKHNEFKILEVYKCCLMKESRLPSFSDIMEEVSSSNEEIFYEAAAIEFEEEYDISDPIWRDRDEVEEMISGLSYQWNDTHARNGLTFRLEEFVVYVLEKERASYTIDKDDDLFYKKELGRLGIVDNVIFVANDCQNILFPKFITNNCLGYVNIVHYYQEISRE